MSVGSYDPCRVVLILSRRLYCELFEHVLSAFPAIRVVGTAIDSAVGLGLVAKYRPRVVVVDASTPGDASFTILDTLATTEKFVRTIVLDSEIYELQVKQALILGAAGIFTFNDSIAEIANGIVAVGQGGFAFCHQLSKAIAFTSEGPRLAPKIRLDDFESLSPRELDVLACLVKGDTIRGCARRLDIAESTVDNHKTRIMRKLKTHRMVDLVKLAIRKRLIPDL